MNAGAIFFNLTGGQISRVGEPDEMACGISSGSPMLEIALKYVILWNILDKSILGQIFTMYCQVQFVGIVTNNYFDRYYIRAYIYSLKAAYSVTVDIFRKILFSF